MIVLDTHVWVWWVSDPGQLSRRARLALNKAVGAEEIYVSSISVWEVALLVARGRLTLTMGVDDWIARCEALPFLQFAPVDNHVALKSTQLQEPFHQDPADRIIVATALTLGAALVTRDEKLRCYPYVETIW